MPAPSRFAAALAATFALAGCAAHEPPPKTAVVPLHRVRLYETGVGYFERRGRLGDGDGGTLPVPAGHLDDALKTLVVMSAGTRIEALRWDGSASPGAARARAGLDGGATDAIDYRGLLASMKGERVTITARGGPLVGRVVDVADEPVPNATPKRTEPALLVLGDDGAVHRLRAGDFDGVRPLDPAFAERLARFLGATGNRAAQALRLLRLASTAEEPVTFGYVAETPVWRTTYRLVFAPDRKSATLQGFALVHNDTDESWRGVSLSLENGKPDSFLFPLAAPRYVRRELRVPAGEMYTLPQLESQTPDAMWSDQGGLGLSGVGEGGGGYGEGIGLGSIGTVGHGSGRAAEAAYASSDALSVGNLAQGPSAAGTEHGAIFSYAIAKPLDLDGHGSALVPFLQQTVSSRAVTLFAAAAEQGRTAVRIVNDTGQTLPEGTMAFYGDGGFVGESLVDRSKPGETRFLEFGTDLDVRLELDAKKERLEPQRAVLEGDRLVVHVLRTIERRVHLESKSGVARTVLVAMPIVTNAKIDGADGTDFDPVASVPYASFELAPMQTLDRSVITTEGVERARGLEQLTEKELRELAAAPTLRAADRAVLVDAAQRARDLGDAIAAIASLEKERAIAEGDAQRLEETLKAAGDKQGAGPNPIVKRLLDAEDRLAKLRDQERARALEHTARREALRSTLSKLTENP